MAVEILDTPMYAIREAARLLNLPSQKLRRWLEGMTVRGRRYPPVIRLEPTGADIVTWAEFVEAGFLREYRKRVSLQHLRAIVDALREDFSVQYPLAYFHPLVDTLNRELVPPVEDGELMRHRGRAWQLQWASAVSAFLEKVDFDPLGVVERMHPLGKMVPVAIDPRVTFGIPQVRGVRTETIAEAFGWGESESRIAESWGLKLAEVQAALQWEMSLKGRRAA